MSARVASEGSGDVRGPDAGPRAALRVLVDAVREDHANIRRMQAKYSGKVDRPRSLAADLVQQIGFQIVTSYRVMRFLRDAGVPVAPKIASRVIRHLYGSDIHWDAALDPGVMIVHGMGLAISHAARVGRGVLLNQNVTLGMGIHPDTREVGAPTLEDDVHVGAGATLLGPITIGRGSRSWPGAS